MNSGYGDDIFENGWAASSPEQPLAFGSRPVLAEPAVLSSKASQQYQTLYEHLHGKVKSVTELEAVVFAPLIAHHSLTGYQSSRIIDTMYDHNILPPNVERNFHQIMGLLALELEVSGLGDYVTLQFRLNSGLPPLPEELYQLLLSDEGEQKPLSHQDSPGPLASLIGNLAVSDSAKPQDTEWTATTLDNPLMADHSVLLIDPDSSVADAAHGNDESYVKKYITDLRDEFSPLVGAVYPIKIKEVPEKEGLVFKHINYTITHELSLGVEVTGGAKKVIRRYSDFVWLLEFLLKKYPLRVIPGLPPKKFTGMFLTSAILMFFSRISSIALDTFVTFL
ncbi:hypothetical protein PUMCH_000943 [Australozyma saopauloensis]|uniref:Sorting nexin MVP1 n=1 Tax=Australozyma saopauloensis TaxID=291208 RepID=A0AAX4H5A5_9ASCO|nr:hypothetical protein PUMCH_000943 [[Candida] saopauloensis]